MNFEQEISWRKCECHALLAKYCPDEPQEQARAQRVQAGLYPNNPNSHDMLTDIISYECGEMNARDWPGFFQRLIDTDMVWNLQGHYGRMACNLAAAGEVTLKALRN